MSSYSQRNTLLNQMGYATYTEYLASELWYNTRARAFAEHGKICVLCSKTARVIHHISYSEEALNGKDLSQLVPLCHECHKKVEFTESGDKRTLDESTLRFVLLLRATKPQKVSAVGKKSKARHRTNKYLGQTKADWLKGRREVNKDARMRHAARMQRCIHCSKNWAKKYSTMCRPCLRIMEKTA